MKQIIKVKDIEMKYGVFGKGNKILIILPGISLKSVVEQLDAVENTFKDFVDDYTIYLFDRRLNPPEQYTLRQMSFDTIDVIKALNIKKANIYGTSQGGMMALYFGVYAKDLIDKICLVSTTHYLDEDATKLFNVWKNYADKKDPVSLTKAFINYVYSKELVEKYGQSIVDNYADTSLEELRLFSIYNDAFFTIDIKDEIKKISCPVLIQSAKGDKIFSYIHTKEIVEILNCEAFFYDENAPHAIYDEYPLVLERAKEFFQK